jgi:hypothetical protein
VPQPAAEDRPVSQGPVSRRSISRGWQLTRLLHSSRC